MVDWLDAIIQGVLLGGLYALFAIGLSITYGVMRLVNIAHGDFLVLAAYLALVPVLQLNMHPFVAILPVMLLMFCLGYTLQRALLNRTMGRSALAPLLATFGLAIILRNGLLQTFKSDSRSLQVGDLLTQSIPIGGGISIGAFPLIVFLTAIALTLIVSLIFARTRIGIALRATSDDADTAGLMGIRARHTYAIAMAISFALIAVGGIFSGIRTTFAPEFRPRVPALCVRGGGHRRPGIALGHVRGRHHPRCRAGHRRQDRRRVRRSRRPSRFSRGAVLQAFRSLPEDRLMRRTVAYVVSRSTRLSLVAVALGVIGALCAPVRAASGAARR